jgi:hypothetical protein
VQEGFAARQLLEAHELVGLVSLVDRPRTADHRRDPRPLKEPGFGPERHQRRLHGAGQPGGQRHGRLVRGGLERRHRAQRLEAKPRGRIDGFHLGFQTRRISGDTALQARHVGTGQVAEFVVEAAVLGHDVVGDTAADGAHGGGGIGHVEPCLSRLLVAQFTGDAADVSDNARCGFDGVDRLRRER